MARLTALWKAALVCIMLGAACAKGAAKPRCKATYVIPMTWVSSVDGSYSAAINITLENVGMKAFSRGEHNFTYQNQNLLGLRDSFGFNVTGSAVGCAYGILSLNSTLLPNATVDIGGVLIGSSPQNFYPQHITLDGVECKTQQAK